METAGLCWNTPHSPLRPDIVWWSEDLRELWLLELTIIYESVVADARERKRSKYYDLVETGRAAGYRYTDVNLSQLKWAECG